MGRDRVRRILRDLEQAGYLIRARSKTNDGRWMWCELKILTSARLVMDICPPDQRQAVLNEIDAMHVRSKLLRPLGLLKALATKAASGQFVPNYSRSNAPQSEAKTRRDFVVSDSPIGRQAATRSPLHISDTGRETIAWLRKNFKIDSS